MRRNVLLACLTALGLILGGSFASADTIIDDFQDFNPGLWPLTANNGTPVDQNSEGGLAGVVGGVRDASSNHQAGPSDTTADIPLPGVYSLSSDALTDGFGTLNYDAGGAGLNLDFLAKDPALNGDVLIQVISSDLAGVNIDVTLSDGGGGSDTQGIVVAGAGDFAIPLSSFVGVDFSDIDGALFQFDPQQSGDIALSLLGFDWPEDSTQVPEPASVAIWSLLGLAMGGFGYLRFRRKK